MGRSRREQLLLAGLLVVLAAVGYRAWRGTTVAQGSASNRGAAQRPARGQQARLEAPDVHLQALEQDVPPPEEGGRDLFRFGARQTAQAGPPPSATARPSAAPPMTAGAPSADASAPIGLKFIGLVGPADSDVRIAILSDGRGPLFGQEGDVIAGRYRILHIGTESIEMAYLDGRGRQTIRLSGS